MKYVLLFLCLIMQTTVGKLPPSLATALYRAPLGQCVQNIMATRVCAQLEGLWCDTHIPHWTHYSIKRFAEQNAINLNEALKENITDYNTFNEFFTRKLKPETRPIADLDDNHVITSPADGHIIIIDSIDQETNFFVKNKSFSLKTFLNSARMAKEFDQGTLMIIYLSPADYHRFHMPCAGSYAQEQIVHGTYNSVYPGIFAYLEPLSHNERHILSVESSIGNTFVYAPVGAMLVGKIAYTNHENSPLGKGAEIGYFSFGGSTIVLLFKKDACILDKEWDSARIPKETLPFNQNNVHQFMDMWAPIKMGQRLGILNTIQTFAH